MTSRARPRSAVDKRDHAPPPEVQVLRAAKGPSYPRGRMLIASPLAVGAVVARVPRGKVLRMGDLRAALARAHKADYTCPLTTGIFLRIAAEAAEEERAAGNPKSIPWWRVVRDDGALIDKLPGGTLEQGVRLLADGVAPDTSRRTPRVDVATRAWIPS